MNQSKGKVRPQTSKLNKRVNKKVNKAKNPKRNDFVSESLKPMRQVAAAAAYSTGQSVGKAKVIRNSIDSVRIVHRELVGSVTGSAAFAVLPTLVINPGLQASFPWLSTQALGWEKYRFNRLRLCSYTRTGTNVPGSLILAPDYDATDPAPVSETVACSYHGTQEDVPWKDICLEYDPKILQSDRFIRTGSVPANNDIKTYDIANTFICTIDGTAVSWAKLWLEYDVTLINPQLPPGGNITSGTLVSAGGTIAAATPFGAAPVSTGSYNITGAATNVLTLVGLVVGVEYAFTFTSTGTVITGYANSGTSGLTGKTVLATGCINAAATIAAYSQTFTPTATTATFTLNVTATTIVSTQVVITALQPAPTF